MAKVICKRTDCTFISKSGFCQKDHVFLTPQGFCNEWFSDQGVPYREQMSEYLRKEFEAYDKRNINDTKDNMATAENDTTDDTNSSSDGGDKTAVEEIKETEEEVIE
jgi:hypothetical protein